MAGRRRGERGDGESRGKTGAMQRKGGSSWKGKEEGRGAQGRECILQVERRGRDTRGLHHIKMQHKKPKSGVDLGASICTWKKRKKEKEKSKLHTMIAYVSSFLPALLSASSEGKHPTKKYTKSHFASNP